MPCARMKNRKLYLKTLLKCSPCERKSHVLHDRDSNIKFICECALNVLKGNIPITPSQKRALARYKDSLRKLANKRSKIKYKRSLLSQTGNGFWLALLPAAISAITSLFT
jgi:hypothetical protein